MKVSTSHGVLNELVEQVVSKKWKIGDVQMDLGILKTNVTEMKVNLQHITNLITNFC